MLLDARGIVVAGTSEEAIGKFPSTFSASATVDETTRARRTWRTAEIRIEEQQLGVLALEISDAPLLRTTHEARNLDRTLDRL